METLDGSIPIDLSWVHPRGTRVQEGKERRLLEMTVHGEQAENGK